LWYKTTKAGGLEKKESLSGLFCILFHSI